MDLKKCSKCREEKPVNEYWRHPQGVAGLTSSCKSCHRLAAANWRLANPEKMKLKTEKKRLESLATPTDIKRHRQIKHKYGIGLDDWKRMFAEQNGCCAICARHQSELARVLQIDHDHKTGAIRGLLCTKCNTKLAVVEEQGFFDRANIYLRSAKIKLVESK